MLISMLFGLHLLALPLRGSGSEEWQSKLFVNGLSYAADDGPEATSRDRLRVIFLFGSPCALAQVAKQWVNLGGFSVTSEICVMNRHALVLAADSAATVSSWVGGRREERYFKGSNKIFQISNSEPIGAMIY